MRKTRHLLALLVATLLAVTAPALTNTAAAEPVTTGYAYGTVYDDFFDDALEGANVSLYAAGTSTEGTPDYQGTTEVDGEWTINEIEAGPYTVAFSKAGFETKTTSITIFAGGGSPTWSTYLKPSAWGTLQGTVTVGGTPVRGGCATVTVHRANGAEVLDTETRRGGAWSARVPAGSYQVQAESESSTSGMTSSLACPQGVAAWAGGADQSSATVFSVAKDASVKVSLGLVAHPIISGKVTNRAGQPLVGVAVSVVDGFEHTITDRDGRYALAALPGDYAIEFTDPTHEYRGVYHNGTATVSAPELVTLTAGQKRTMNAVLDLDPTPAPAAAVTGLVTDSTGKPMRGVMVALGEPGAVGGPAGAMTFTTTNGRWSISRDDITPGTYTAMFMAGQVSSSMPEFDADPVFYGNVQVPTKARTFAVGATGVTTLDTVKLTRLGAISGEVTVDSSLAELEGFFVTLSDSSGNLAALTQAYDAFSFANLAPGRYKVSVQSVGLMFGPVASIMMAPMIPAWYGGLNAQQAKWITVAPGAKITGLKIHVTDKIRNVTKPKVTGTAKVGKTLKANPGTWNLGTDMVYTYTWKRGSKTVGTKASYKATKADAGKSLTVTVRTAHRLNSFTPATATSAKAKVAKVKKAKKGTNKR